MTKIIVRAGQPPEIAKPAKIILRAPAKKQTDQEKALDELVQITEELGLYDDLLHKQPSRIVVKENGVHALGRITHIEILEAPHETEHHYVGMLIDPSTSVSWDALMYPVKLPIRRNTLALELHCLLVRCDDVLDILAFWNDDKALIVEYDPKALVDRFSLEED